MRTLSRPFGNTVRCFKLIVAKSSVSLNYFNDLKNTKKGWKLKGQNMDVFVVFFKSSAYVNNAEPSFDCLNPL